MVTLDKDFGYIKGGLCDKEHKNRAMRERGAWWLWERLVRYHYVSDKGGRVLKECKWTWQWIQKRIVSSLGDIEYGVLTAQMEIGALRLQDYHNARDGHPYPTNLKSAIEKAAAAVDLSGAVHQDHIYKQRKKRGDFDGGVDTTN